MATISDLYPYIMPHVQGCPVQLVVNAAHCALNDFFDKTLMWRHAVAPVDLIEGQREYTVLPPEGSVIAKPLYVAAKSIQLWPTNMDDLDNLYEGWRESSSSQPSLYYMDYSGTLVILPTPTETEIGGLDVEVALRLAPYVTVFPDWVLNTWAEVIAHGALMRLHAMPGKVWADPQTVTYHRTKFREGITFAKSRVMKSFSRQGKSVQPRSFW